jgi:branched-chain amino acid transport system ATP-binding protein
MRSAVSTFTIENVTSTVTAAAPSFATSTEPVIHVECLVKRYGHAEVVCGVGFSVRPGELFGLLGTNGAGKTTTLRAISGFLGFDDARVTEGAIVFKGERIENRLPNENTRRGIVLVPERDKVFPNLTVAENLITPIPRGTSAIERRRRESLVFQFFPQLGDLRNRIGGLLSGGERQMLSLASAIVCRPELLLVDELSLGLAPVVVEDLLRRLTGIRRELGISILIVEQSATVALEIADYGYVMENGRIVLDGTAERLRNHPDIQEFYLGRSGGERRSYRDVKQYRRSRRWYG